MFHRYGLIFLGDLFRRIYQLKNKLTFLKGNEIKARALRGSLWTILGYGAAQFIRLGSNLILTRLLFPEAFGIMAIIQVFMQGVSMFSDIGIGASIIQNEKGNSPIFLNTAWTVQVIRGVVLFIVIASIAIPLSSVYQAPSLALLMPVAGFSAVIAGFTPTKLQTEHRNLILGKLTIAELLSQLTSVLILIALAWWTRSVWSLVLGGLVGNVVKLYLVHKLIEGPVNRFAWDVTSVKSLVNFGKWIFAGSLVGFFANQSDKLILASYMTKSDLGVYSIAFGIANIIWALHSKINRLIFFPVYVQLKDISLVDLVPKVFKARVVMCFFLMPPLILLIIYGEGVINFLYDDRYRSAGWMLQILCIGYVLSIATNIGPFYLAQGNSKLLSKLISAKALIFIFCMVLGGETYGVKGVLVGNALAHLIFYLVESSVYRYFKLWIWKIDAIAIAVIITVIYVVYEKLIFNLQAYI